MVSFDQLAKQRSPFYNWENRFKRRRRNLPKIHTEAKIPVKNLDSKACLLHHHFFLFPWRHADMPQAFWGHRLGLAHLCSPRGMVSTSVSHNQMALKSDFHISLFSLGGMLRRQTKSKRKWDKYLKLYVWAGNSRNIGILYKSTSELWIPYWFSFQLRWGFKGWQKGCLPTAMFLSFF